MYRFSEVAIKSHIKYGSISSEEDYTKLLNKMKVNYDSVKEQFKYMTTSEDDFIDNPKAESFPSEENPKEDNNNNFS